MIFFTYGLYNLSTINFKQLSCITDTFSWNVPISASTNFTSSRRFFNSLRAWYLKKAFFIFKIAKSTCFYFSTFSPTTSISVFICFDERFIFFLQALWLITWAFILWRWSILEYRLLSIEVLFFCAFRSSVWDRRYEEDIELERLLEDRKEVCCFLGILWVKEL